VPATDARHTANTQTALEHRGFLGDDDSVPEQHSNVSTVDGALQRRRRRRTATWPKPRVEQSQIVAQRRHDPDTMKRLSALQKSISDFPTFSAAPSFLDQPGVNPQLFLLTNVRTIINNTTPKHRLIQHKLVNNGVANILHTIKYIPRTVCYKTD